MRTQDAGLVRAATQDDLAAVVALARTTRLFGFLSPSVFSDSINKGELLIVTSDYLSIIAGFLRFHARQNPPRVNTIYELYIVPHFRRQGYATALFNAVSNPKRLKCPNTHNYAPAHAFYAAQHPTQKTIIENMTLYVFES